MILPENFGGKAMLDVILIGAVLIFFMLSRVYLAGVEKL